MPASRGLPVSPVKMSGITPTIVRHGCVDCRAAEADPLAERILRAEELPDERLVHDDDWNRLLSIVGRERAPVHRRYLEGGEESWRDDERLRERIVAVGRVGLAFDREAR